MSVDSEANRISLGIKQMNSDPVSEYMSGFGRGSIVTGEITEVDSKGATVKLSDDVTGYLKASEINRDKVEDASKEFKVGDSVEAKIIGADRKTRTVSLSIKAKDEAEERAHRGLCSVWVCNTSRVCACRGAALRSLIAARVPCMLHS